MCSAHCREELEIFRKLSRLVELPDNSCRPLIGGFGHELFRDKLLDLLIQEEGVKTLLLHNPELGLLNDLSQLMFGVHEAISELFAGKDAIYLTNVVGRKGDIAEKFQ